jgi:DNA-binding transcriptional ArsR family regulator
MANYGISLSDVFHALGDPTRYSIVNMLSNGELPVSALADPFKMALPSFLKHLTILERCGLIRSSKSGRVRTCELVPDTLSQAEQWIAEQRAMWETKADRMVVFVENLHQESLHDK